jgi:hypothetical protein
MAHIKNFEKIAQLAPLGKIVPKRRRKLHFFKGRPDRGLAYREVGPGSLQGGVVLFRVEVWVVAGRQGAEQVARNLPGRILIHKQEEELTSCQAISSPEIQRHPPPHI